MTGGCVAVLDIGKTNVKVALVDLARGEEVAVRRMPNRVLNAHPYPHFDTEEHWRFFMGSLRELSATRPVEAISITTHGATGALLDASGELVLPILDYEHDGPERVATEYDQLRPSFEETGSPRLGVGLNLGAQIYWQMQSFENARRAALFLTYPQYWSYRLTGVAAVEPTSLGCHTDLWTPREGGFSSLVTRMGWDGLMPPVRRAGDVLGPVLPDIAAETGLPPDTPVLCGIHDSNASLYPHLLNARPPFCVVSTGTWVICMGVGIVAPHLDADRDTLINVDAFGAPVPSARFMGGREYEVVRQGRDLDWSDADAAEVLRKEIMLLPAVEAGSGPFRGHAARWTVEPDHEGVRAVGLSWYLALMTATCLGMLGGGGRVIVEGPFAANDQYLAMLAAATGRPVTASTSSVTGTAVGAALLAGGATPRQGLSSSPAIQPDPALKGYAAAWQIAASGHTRPVTH